MNPDTIKLILDRITNRGVIFLLVVMEKEIEIMTLRGNLSIQLSFYIFFLASGHICCVFHKLPEEKYSFIGSCLFGEMINLNIKYFQSFQYIKAY